MFLFSLDSVRIEAHSTNCAVTQKSELSIEKTWFVHNGEVKIEVLEIIGILLEEIRFKTL